MKLWNGKLLVISTTALAAAIMAPAFAMGGGGGGGGGTPSQSAPAYDPAVDYQKGATAFRAGQYADAIKSFKRVVGAMPRNAQAQYLLGASYMALSDFKKAKGPMTLAVKHDDKMIDAHRDLGIIHAKLGAAAKANEQLDALKSLEANCGSGCRDQKQLKEAIAKLEAALVAGKTAMGPVQPDIVLAQAIAADATYVQAVALINEKRYVEAIAELDKALWAAGPHPDILTYLGFANRKLHNYEEAEGYYQAALSIAPKHRGAIEYYGELKLERGNVVGAKAHLAQLETICGYGCHEADELRRWIKEAATSAS
ncbi:tetratricopeptide repeat protein [Sphingorhabdus sp. IMCC26285]|uniref:Tetratricopeptide repeat protein n=1 Tax=Sphingorhabdus profundilacus TaxID=2509718 RepID=A0A6I4LSV8_9SPHN|nr:tetratricopeptide repeat protein [Sphingorhabdus profundilacus]MVZ96512.1 tetratricopeptide repeat protein [Sphingorhabdus profundilacus]